MSSPAVSNAVVEGCSGALGSVAALLATYPLKTIYTLQALSTGDTNGAAGVAEPSSRLLVLARFLQQYKLSTLYAGLGPNVVESALSSGVYFFFYSKLRETAVAWSWSKRGGGSGGESRSRDIGVLASLLVATTAGALNQLITMPVSVVATRVQGYQSLKGASASTRPPTTWETIASVFREDGLAGFWKGLLPSMILLANPAVQYMLFEKIKALFKFWKEQRLARSAAAGAAAAGGGGGGGELLPRRCSADSDEAMAPAAAKAAAAAPPAAKAVTLSAGEVFLAGALAKIGATIVTYPMIVIKARLQASSSSSSAAKAGASSSSSTWGVIVDTARNEGPGGFFKGLRAKILQTALNAALMLMLKEQLHGVTKAALSCCAAAPATTAAPSVAVKAPSAAG
ncbi:hypothetical protein PLESTB_001857200 [Pleodorina starrii]|uniref:Uncharacterized protein n=1 Tax=Pleodorina starrii TaxID=330485 RepID=A0A9W6C2F0_9CHLO|nr:hypothetical protein PLESTM_000591000 [Pleodorina starrii]GLC62225.1 hypothetical protein PLESTB_001857200 [Pleodorina starrii]GLC74031.1 hypothetical protein PLESTF_001452100 [Pleodorina starrii]